MVVKANLAGVNSSWMRKVYRFVEENVGESISLGDIAEAAGLSRYSLCRLFRLKYGKSPMNWLMEFRLYVSMHIFHAMPHLSTQIVAMYAGFSSASHLTRSFRKFIGVTPTEAKGKLAFFLERTPIECFQFSDVV